MPVILRPADYEFWLDPAFKKIDSVSEMLKPFETALMRRYTVSMRVNNVQNDMRSVRSQWNPMRRQHKHNCFDWFVEYA